jgi:hypothetical protein
MPTSRPRPRGGARLCAYAVERFHPRLRCLLLPEGGVGADRHAARDRRRRARVHDRHRRAVPRDAADLAGVRGALRRARSRCRTPRARTRRGRPEQLLRRPRSTRSSARSGAPRLDHRDPPRAGADARAARSSSATSARDLEGTTRSPTGPRRTSGGIHEHDLPYNPLHDQGYESIGCAPCTQPGSGREGRWAGRTRPSAASARESRRRYERELRAATPQLSL